MTMKRTKDESTEPSLLWCIGDAIRDNATRPLTWGVVATCVAVIAMVMTYEPDELRNTPAGAFALDTVEQCLSSGLMIGPKPTNAACINTTITTAKNLRGDQFADEVKTVLANKFAPQ